MEDYKQLSPKERRQIGVFLEMGYKVSKIANRLARHRSTIYRELNRNEENGYYSAYQAQLKTQMRKHRKPMKLIVNTTCYKYVMEKLKLGWSPEQIAGRMRVLNLAFRVCHETIYQYVYRHARAHIFYYLPMQRKKRQARRKRKSHHSCHHLRHISMRPKAVINRHNLGHWEGDTIRFAGERKQSVTTLVERKSRYLVLQKNNRSTTQVVMNHISSAIAEFPRKLWKSLTFDQGSEFMDFAAIERQTQCKVYYANPRSPWERGTNENTNKRLRRYLPKDANIRVVEQGLLSQLAQLLNNTPRKCLDYLTPSEVFYSAKKLAVALDSGI